MPYHCSHSHASLEIETPFQSNGIDTFNWVINSWLRHAQAFHIFFFTPQILSKQYPKQTVANQKPKSTYLFCDKPLLFTYQMKEDTLITINPVSYCSLYLPGYCQTTFPHKQCHELEVLNLYCSTCFAGGLFKIVFPLITD